jgi:cytidine deaminase
MDRKLTKKDRELIQQAKALVGTKKVRGGKLKEVGCVLVTKKDKLFKGVNIDLSCGIGFCAEHTAIAAMVTNTNETKIKTIVAISKYGALPPCGRCRELMSLIDKKNLSTMVIISHNKKVPLRQLLPHTWNGNEQRPIS